MRPAMRFHGVWIAIACAMAAVAQVTPPPGFNRQPFPPTPQTPQQQPAQQPGAQQANPTKPQAPAATAPAQPAGPPTTYGGLSLNNVSLTEVIDLLAHQLKINYILDPRVKGGVILNTYGETKDVDTRSLLETILRINGFGMVKQGDLYRIVPLAEISHLPVPPEKNSDPDKIADDDKTMLNLVFLKYMSSSELIKVLQPFIGENASIYEYAPANLLLILDSDRNMRRLMKLIAEFDSSALVNQRVRVFQVKNSRPSDLAKELDGIVKSISLSEKNSPIKFLPIDRINSIIAVSSNPGAFEGVQGWIDKLDTPVKAAAGGVSDYVYRVRYGDAQAIGCSIQALYGQLSGYGYGFGSNSIAMCAGYGNGFGGGGIGIGGGLGGYGGGGGYGGYGGYGGGYGGYGGGMYGGGMYGPGGYGGYGAPAAYPPPGNYSAPLASPPPGTASAASTGTDLTGQYLGTQQAQAPAHVPRVVANPLNNTLLIQATPQEYENILGLLKDLDVPPRQVLIEAKIYSIDLTHAFSSDVQAKLQQLSGTTSHTFLANFGSGVTNLSTAALVGKSRELLAAVQLQENESRAKVLSAPSVVATDSIPATINVGTTVPTLTAQAVTGVQQGGNSLFANSVANTNTGVTLNIIARVTPSGVVTMIIDQQVSAPTPTTTSNIQSPSFDQKSIRTQITVQDGDTIAIGGIIDEQTTQASSGIPVLHRIPILGGAFGFRSYNKERTELIIFITPRVIYDANSIADATDELKGRVKLLKKDIQK